MALSPNDGEAFLREVDEELRKEQARNFVSRYLWWLLAASLLVLGAAGGWLWWQERQKEAAGADGERLLAALASLETGGRAAAAPKLAELSQSSREGYRAAALLARANSETAGGNIPAAIATLRSMQTNEDFHQIYREAALIRLTALEFDTLRPQVGRAAAAAAHRQGSPWLGTAGELVGIAYQKLQPAARRTDVRPRRARRECARIDPHRTSQMASCSASTIDEPAERRPRPAAAGSSRGNKRKMKRVVLALVMASLLAGCSLLGRGNPTTTPTVGQRIPVLARESQVEPDPLLAAIPVTVPPPVANTEWAQPGGNAAKAMGHVTLGDAPTRAWSVSIGNGNSFRTRLVAEPVAADGRVYTIDTMARVRAFDIRTGAQIWEHQVRGENSPPEALFGGGVSYDNGRVYATNGAGDAAALDAATGNQIWIVKPGGPLRGAPTVALDAVYALSQDSQLYALDTSNGETRWSGSGSFELAGVFGSAAPAFAQSTLVAGFSSGELTAYRYENGQVVWQDALARTGMSTTVGQLSDIDADPVIDQGRVFAIGQGGRMVAVELITGQRAWELNIGGLSTPWVAGDWVFVVTDRAQLLAVARSSGRVRWVSQLPGFRRPPETRTPSRDDIRAGRTGTVRPGVDPIYWRGPVLAGNRLVLAGSNGNLIFASPVDGTVQSTVEHRVQISLPPVVSNDTLLILDDEGRLTAWR